MSSPFLGEVRLFAGNFAISGWAVCNGAVLSISQNSALFSILGTTYGGNGVSTFALPNFQGATPVGAGNGAGLTAYVPGEVGGSASIVIDTSTTPRHDHLASAVDGFGQSSSPGGNLWAQARVGRGGVSMYSDILSSPAALNPAALGSSGAGGAHNNVPPVLALTFLIALVGTFPQRN